MRLDDWTSGTLDWYHRGKLADPKFPVDDVFDMFLSGVRAEHHPIRGECWVRDNNHGRRGSWTGGYTSFYSGLLYSDGRKKYVPGHVFSLSVKLGRDITPGLLAAHSCHNKPCVRPCHLREGTHADVAATERWWRASRMPETAVVPGEH